MKTLCKWTLSAVLWSVLLFTFSCDVPPAGEDNPFPETPDPGFVTHPENLNVVYFVPNDNPEVADYKDRLSELLIYFQDYIKSEMDRNGFGEKTFGLPLDSVNNRVKLITIYGEHDQATYDYGSGSTIINEINAYKASHPGEFTSQHNLIILPQRTDGGSQPFYGWGRSCFAVDNPNISVEEIPSTSSNLIAGMLHELGHGLNLAHNKATVSDQQTLGTSLMGSGNYTWGREATFIPPADCAILNRNQVFQSNPVSDIYGGATTTVTPVLSYDDMNDVIQLSGTFTSDKPVSKVLVWLDPNVNGEGSGVNKDYNSVSWIANKNNNSFQIDIPIGEIQDHGDWPYELKIKLLLENGTIKTHTYSFEFVNGEYTQNTKAGVFQHSSYNGWGVELEVGSYSTNDLITLGGLDNDISSVKVPLGLKVTLYSEDNFTGESYELTGDVSFLSSFNDKASSIIVSEN
ncbi:beta/gamma crystallin family protein [Sinomicrobium kalidii]|uniref:beta/gamma crystallin family protein n=1 Tax=Sinomicrobium kalidii TaxID=2900738 RepID=UPI001E35877A|nr:beta/gamma crystallin family protein [Sinomicrobium kalidii]UGU16662.1 beta/gamma crystallin family protein [Sinomicrobium kalidii]